MVRFTTLIIFLLALLLVTSCATQEQNAATPWNISAMLYSGIANPEGRLSAEQAETLIEMVSALPATAPVAIGGLGYSGFTALPTQAGSNAILSITAYNGTVAVARSNGTQYYRDNNREVEQWLLDAAVNGNWLSENEAQLIQEELAGNSQ